MRHLMLCALFFASSPVFAQDAIDVDLSPAVGGCAVFEDGGLWCWDTPGQDSYLVAPQPAGEPMRARRMEGFPSAVSVSVSAWGGCLIDPSSNLWCWGLDLQKSIREDRAIVSRTPFRVEGLKSASAVELGFAHACAITGFLDRVKCWGANAEGELGVEGENRREPVKVPWMVGAVSLSAGVNNTCAVLNNGELNCWGTDRQVGGSGIIFDGHKPFLFSTEIVGEFRSVSNGRNFVCGIRTTGEVTCLGSNILKQLGTPTVRLGEAAFYGIGEVAGLSDAVDIDAGYFGACAVEEGKVFCWGTADYQAAYDQVDPQQVPGIESAEKVAVGTSFSCAIDAGAVLCWGKRKKAADLRMQGMTPTRPVPIPGLPD